MNGPITTDDIKREARAVLEPFGRGEGELERLMPQPEDFARVFRGDAAAQARAGFAPIWEAMAAPAPKGPGAELLIHAAPASVLGDDNELSRRFPNGYRRIAATLVPERIWLGWKFVAPGEASGMAYDGLVWLDGRFAWFPKPWRVLAAAGDSPAAGGRRGGRERAGAG